MISWKPLSGRITLFPNTATSVTAAELYRKIWSSDPDGFQKQAAGLFPMSFANGQRSGMTVHCSVQQGRIDLTFGPQDGELAEELPLIQDAIAVANEMNNLADVIASDPLKVQISRVACAWQFAVRQATFAEANRVLSTVLPENSTITLDQQEDFILQLNEVRNSEKVVDTRLNIITKWSVERITRMRIAVPPAGNTMDAPQVGLLPPTLVGHLVPMVSFDFNNAPQRVLSSSEQHTLIKELLHIASSQQRHLRLELGSP